mmetsp:Transcript_19831/g.55284  ORF Transcript_19831/g.55284 Transcript_19831/m.55284 type:complete len:85 (-) Transcript_19831:1473-1727(-)
MFVPRAMPCASLQRRRQESSPPSPSRESEGSTVKVSHKARCTVVNRVARTSEESRSDGSENQEEDREEEGGHGVDADREFRRKG